jgi:hypothetical protein
MDIPEAPAVGEEVHQLSPNIDHSSHDVNDRESGRSILVEPFQAPFVPSSKFL